MHEILMFYWLTNPLMPSDRHNYLIFNYQNQKVQRFTLAYFSMYDAHITNITTLLISFHWLRKISTLLTFMFIKQHFHISSLQTGSTYTNGSNELYIYCVCMCVRACTAHTGTTANCMKWSLKLFMKLLIFNYLLTSNTHQGS